MFQSIFHILWEKMENRRNFKYSNNRWINWAIGLHVEWRNVQKLKANSAGSIFRFTYLIFYLRICHGKCVLMTPFVIFHQNKMNLPWIIRKYVEILEFAFRSLLMNNAKLWIIFKIKTHWIKMDFSLDWSVDLEQHILVWQLLNSPTIWSNQILILKSDQFFVRVELTAYCFHPHNIFLSSKSVWRGSIIC